MKNENLYRSLKYLLFLLFVFTIPFNTIVSSYIIICLGILVLIDFDKYSFRANFIKRRWLYFSFLMLYFLNIVGLIWTENTEYTLKLLEHKIFILIFPLIVVSVNFTNKEFRLLFKVFVGTCILILLISFSRYFIMEILNKEFLILGEKEIGNYVGTRSEWFSKHFIIIGTHRTFFSSYIMICFLLLLHNYKRSPDNMNLFTKLWLGFQFLVLFLSLIVIQSKLGFLCFVFLLGFYLVKYFFSLDFKFKILISLGFLSFILLMGVFFSDRMRTMIQEIKTIYYYENTKEAVFTSKLRPGSTQIRYMVYKSSIELIGQSPVFGYGAGDVDKELTRQLGKNRFSSISHLGYGPHSQFLYETLAHGIFGFLTLLSLFLMFFRYYKDKDDYLKYGIVFIVIIFCTFESYLNSRAGLLPTIFFLSLIGYKTN